MTKQSPHKSWKGCALCKPHKNKLASYANRTKFTYLRKLGAKSRVSRKTVGCD